MDRANNRFMARVGEMKAAAEDVNRCIVGNLQVCNVVIAAVAHASVDRRMTKSSYDCNVVVARDVHVTTRNLSYELVPQVTNRNSCYES